MNYFFKLILITCLFFFGQSLSAEENHKRKQSNTIELIAGLSKPPFIIEEGGTGIELDIFNAAFATVNKEVSFIHVPFGRAVTGYQSLNVDGIITVLPNYQHPNLFVSQPYINYQNVAVSLFDNQLEIDDIQALAGKSMIAFQNAKKYLGEDFNKVISSAMNYREVADQMKQIDMLFLRRTEVIILDINIFRYFLKTHTSAKYAQPFAIHHIFKERPYSAAFKTEKNRDLFEQGIKTIKEQGTYQLIMDKYLSQ